MLFLLLNHCLRDLLPGRRQLGATIPLVLSEGITESSVRGRRPKNLLFEKGQKWKERLLSGIEGLSFHQGQIVPGVVRKK